MELPELPAGGGIVGADVAPVFLVPVAPAKSLEDFALDDNWSARVRISLRVVANRRLPDELARARLERNHACIVGGEKELVLVDRDASRAVRRRHPQTMLPNQVALAGVERLQHVTLIHQIHDAVVHERRRLVPPPTIRHRPDPGQPEILDVARRDLREGAVAPRLIIAANHQPVAGRRVLQHLIGHRNEVLHLARDRQPARTLLALALPLTLLTRRFGGRLRRRRSRLPGRDRSDCDRGGGRQRLRSRRRPVDLKDVGNDRKVRRFTQGSLRAGRHRQTNSIVEILGRELPPCSDEIGARERGRFAGAAQVGPMTARAVGLVGVASGLNLGGGERSRHARLALAGNRGPRRACCARWGGSQHNAARRYEDNSEEALRCRSDHGRRSSGKNQPHRFPSGAFSL